MYKISKQEKIMATSQTDVIASLIIDSQAGLTYYKVFKEFIEKTAHMKVNTLEPRLENKEGMKRQLAEMLMKVIDIAVGNE